jgi:translation elongation factor EF-1alpha
VLWQQERYEYIVNLLLPYLISVGFKKDDIQFVPISGLEGHNLITRHEDPNLTKWYSGECLIEILDKVKVPPRLITKPLRLSVMDYIARSKGEMIGDVVQAKVESGIIHEKDSVLLMPQGALAIVKGIEI